MDGFGDGWMGELKKSEKNENSTRLSFSRVEFF